MKLSVSALLLVALAKIAATADSSFPDHPVGTWVRHTPRDGVPAPRIIYEGSAALDPRRSTWIHYGGHDGIPQGFCLFACDMKTGRWEQRFPATSPPGVCCIDGSNTFDVANDRFVAFPGGSLGHGYQWSRGVKLKQSNVWLYDPAANEWTNMRPPPYRQPEKYSRDVIGSLDSGGTYDPVHEVSIAFGGQGAGGSTSALWVYDAYANRLERLRPPESPEERDGMGLCYDEKHDCLVIFGSQYGNDERIWLYRNKTNRWEGYSLDPSPPGRREGTYSTNPKLAYDSRNGVCLCVVRRGEKSGLPTGTLETWALDVGALKWKKLSPETPPDRSESRARNLAYWPEQNLFVLESVAADRKGVQLWTFRYKDAPADDRPPRPGGVKIVTSSDGAHVSWERDPTGKTRAYNVYRSDEERTWLADFQKVATTARPLYDDRDVAPGKTFLYRVTGVDGKGNEGPPGPIVRSQPRVPGRPVVSVLAAGKVRIDWPKHPSTNIEGYNLYRGLATVGTTKGGKPAPWQDNDPPYDEPVVVSIEDITELTKLNAAPLSGTSYTDDSIDLATKTAASGDYRLAVYAYVVRAVNKLGTQSGPSPYALTIPSEPRHVLLREQDGTAHIKWEPAREQGIAGYHVYKLGQGVFDIERLTEAPLREPKFEFKVGGAETRFWVTAIDALGQEGQPSSPVWANHAYRGFFEGDWHQ
jgi:hypothetical protein